MKKGIPVLFSVWLFLSTSLLYSSPADTSSIIDNIYNFDFLKAKEQLSRIDDNLINETLNLEITWWMAIESGNEDQFSEFLNKLDTFEAADCNHLTEIISSTYRMRYYASKNKVFRLPFLLMKVNQNIEEIDNKELTGLNREEHELYILYRTFLTLVENSYSFQRILPCIDNTKELIGDIEDVIISGSSPNKTIGRYFLMKYYLDIEKDKPKAYSYLVELHKQYPQNIIFTQLLSNK
jgi:hypothetical protein